MDNYVVVIGNVGVDEYYQCLDDIRVGDKFFVKYIESIPGGMTANAAAVMSMLGTTTYMLTELGDDSFTEWLKESFEQQKVNIDYVGVLNGYVNCRTNILLSPNNLEKTIVLFDNTQKPILVMNKEKEKLLHEAAYVYGLISDIKAIDNYENLLTSMKRNGVKFMFDVERSTFTNKDEPQDKFFFDIADVLSFNEFAIEKYCSGNEKAIENLIGGSEKIVITTLGANGCTVKTKDQEIKMESYKVLPADTTGAGDTFNASFLHSLMKKQPLQRCAEFAAAAAGRSIQYIGSRSGAVEEDAVYDFMRSHTNACNNK